LFFGILTKTKTNFTSNHNMARASGAFRAGRVLAPDSKWTGEEPTWKGWEEWPVEKFYSNRMRMFRFYGYYLSSQDLKPAILTYMKERAWPKSAIEKIRGCNPSVMPTTIGKLVRAIAMGMPSKHPKAEEYFAALPFSDPDLPPPSPKDDHDIIADELWAVIRTLQDKTDEETETVQKKPTPNPRERLRNKIETEVIAKLEEMHDDWIINFNLTKVAPLSLTSYIRDGAIPAAGCVFIREWLEKQLSEYSGAYHKTDPELIEGYSYLSRPALKNRMSNLEGMLEEISKVVAVAKTMRKPRVKKPKDATKQAAKVKYQQNSKEYDLTSIDPVRIPTAQRVILFNTKYRTLGVYIARGPAGFEIKGTTIKGFDTENSFIVSLRKPKPVLNTICSVTPKQLEKYLEKEIKTKKRKGNGRINEQTIILRAIETR
jgi:hypothetical protein